MKNKLKSPFLNREARLELTSLMDVMFLVLVFFVYSVFSMSVHRGVKVDLPSAHGQLEKGGRIVVTIDREQKIYVDAKHMELEEAVLEIKKLHVFAKGKGSPILISTDRTVPIGLGVELLARLKQSGIEQVTFQVSGRKETP